MYYIVYQTTNLLNGKIYIGQHQTSDLNDGYLGSGKHLQRAINKYGIENFQKEILYQFDNPENMAFKEAELVTEEFCKREDTYNICPGGKGGFGYINNSLSIKKTTSHLSKYSSENGKKTGRSNILKAHINGLIKYDTWTGKRHSDESKRKMSLSKKGKNRDSLNSQFGSIWITDGFENKKIKKVDQIPEGWYKGRII